MAKEYDGPSRDLLNNQRLKCAHGVAIENGRLNCAPCQEWWKARQKPPHSNVPSHHRTDWHSYYMRQAMAIAGRSTCGSLSGVGAIIVSDLGLPVSQGYNGAPSGWHHCDEVLARCDLYTSDRGRTYSRHVHAEANAIAQAARVGARLYGSTLYVTQLPCADCLKLVVQAGIKGIIYDLDLWQDTHWLKLAKELAATSGVTLHSLEEVTRLERERKRAAQLRSITLESSPK